MNRCSVRRLRESSVEIRKMNSRGARAKSGQKTMNLAKSVPKIPSQMTSLLAERQLGTGDNSYLKFKATMQEIVAKIDCCSLTECSGVPAKNKITLCSNIYRQL